MVRDSGGPEARHLRAIAILALVAAVTVVVSRAGSTPIQRRASANYWRSMGGRLVPGGAFVAQVGHGDCGAAALGQMLTELGVEAGAVDRLRELLPEKEGGTAVGELIVASAEFGVGLSASRVEADDWVHRSPPLLVLLEAHHYVTITGVSRDSATVADPAGGVFRVPLATLAARHPLAVLAQRTRRRAARWP